MTDQQFADAKWRFQSYATHSDGCEYITTLRESFITRPRGKVSECDCWNGSTLAALDYAEKRIAELEADKARLDWLQEHSLIAPIKCELRYRAADGKSLITAWTRYGELSDTLREAVDNAMKVKP